MDIQFCIDALDEALGRYGVPDIFNTDQGSQFTSWMWTQRLKEAGVRISMDGRGRVPRQHLYRTAVALVEVRVRLTTRPFVDPSLYSHESCICFPFFSMDVQVLLSNARRQIS
tara:strand:- start:8612 stop:8950 length:339 start_codon:yes stop_codon:yes gene_type:complete